MGYYSGRGDCMYGRERGDYYRGDYYRGDPGLLSGIGKVVRSVAGVAAKVLPGPLGFAAGAVAGALGGRTAAQGTALAPAPPFQPGRGIQVRAPFGTGISIGEFGPGLPGEPALPIGSMTPAGIVPCQLKGYRPNKSSYYKRAGAGTGILIPKGSVCVKSRRMNPANGRALRRALTRAYAFKKIALRTIKLLEPAKKAKRFGGFKGRGKRA